MSSITKLNTYYKGLRGQRKNIFDALASGLTKREICANMGIEMPTLRHHIRQMRKDWDKTT